MFMTRSHRVKCSNHLSVSISISWTAGTRWMMIFHFCLEGLLWLLWPHWCTLGWQHGNRYPLYHRRTNLCPFYSYLVYPNVRFHPLVGHLPCTLCSWSSGANHFPPAGHSTFVSASQMLILMLAVFSAHTLIAHMLPTPWQVPLERDNRCYSLHL